MRGLRDFSQSEWFRLKPLDHFLIQICNDALQAGFRGIKPRTLDRFLQNAGHASGGNIGLIVAYEQPWALDWLLRTAARNLLDGTLFVFDNSRRPDKRNEIERVCLDRGVPYLALPPCPTRHPNRSHGMAMTWIYYNVVRPLRPRTFSFIDHDLIPMERTGLAAGLGDQPFYGVPNVTEWGWSLWAGYSSFSFSAVHHLPLNFLNDFSRGLDTGGRNWSCLYRDFDRANLRFGGRRRIRVADPLDGSSRRLEVVDGCWIHIGGASYNPGFRGKLDLYERIAKASDEGATLQMLAVEDPTSHHQM
jgi:hypothetical protein